MTTELGSQIQLLLEERGMSRQQLADGVGVSEAAVSRYISGIREPKAITVSKIASVLQVSMDDLYGTEAGSESELSHAVRLVARNAQSITEEQKIQLANALMGIRK